MNKSVQRKSVEILSKYSANIRLEIFVAIIGCPEIFSEEAGDFKCAP